MFYKNGYEIKVINDITGEDLVKEGKVSLDEKNTNYINIKCLENMIEDNTNITIIFKAK